MVKQTIQIFARVKPTKTKTGPYEVTDVEGIPVVSFTVPKDLSHEIVNNKKENYKFRFEKIFDQQARQEDIFDNVAKPVIDSVLSGYNGTIFAYGQTGTGKTFTITGGPEKFADRGIIPRTLSYIFAYQKSHPESEFTTHVSYLEIYNDSGYDLLDPKHEASKLEDLPKVSLMEDSDKNIHLKNLSTHQAGSEEDALNLLFLGDTNRMIAETPMNQASTRSHCIFSVHVSSRESASATVRRAKLHLVDLAGSERVGKTGVDGTLLTEAKYINLSLHYLEQVIVALGEKSREHIPYRNSMMTSVLRDSLGGNCMTTMIATISVNRKNIDESISTCRFAQRVALIKNDALLNEELDPKLMIIRLKKQIQSLKEELAMATGEMRTDELTDEEIDRCREMVRMYLEDTDPDATMSTGADLRKIHKCFVIMKQMILTGGARNTQPSPAPVSARREQTPREAEPSPGESSKLQGLIRQRDNEINILVNMLKKEKKRAADAITALERHGYQLPKSSHLSSESEASVTAIKDNHKLSNGNTSDFQRSVSAGNVAHSRPPTAGHRLESQQSRTLREKEEKTKTQILGDMSLGRQEAFEIFRRDYEHNQAIDDNKALLKQRYAEAKSHGETVNLSRTKINKLKTSIEQHRMSRVMQGLVDPDDPEPDQMERDMKQAMEDEKNRYKDTFSKLRALKTEIEHLQHLLERSKVKLMKDFELWWAAQTASVQEQPQQLKDIQGQGHMRSAWKTPPITPITHRQPSQASVGPHSVHSTSSSSVTQQPSNHDDTSGYSSQESVTSRGASRHMGRKAPESSSIALTGDAQADADIMAFLKARQKVAQKSQQQRPR